MYVSACGPVAVSEREEEQEEDAELAALVLITDVAASISCNSFCELLAILRSAASSRSRHREALPLLLRRLLLASRMLQHTTNMMTHVDDVFMDYESHYRFDNFSCLGTLPLFDFANYYTFSMVLC